MEEDNKKIIEKYTKQKSIFKFLAISQVIVFIILVVIATMSLINARAVSGVVYLEDEENEEIEKNRFNKKFEQYEGSNVRGANVNALINTVVQNNLLNSDNSDRIVTLYMSEKTESGEVVTVLVDKMDKKASTSKLYKVECARDSETGLVTMIYVNEI